MPRIQSHVPSVNYKKMESIIEELINDGATRSEANISSIAAKLIDMGLILWEAQNKPKDEDGEGSVSEKGEPDIEALLRENLKGSFKSELYSQIFLQFLLNPDMTKQAGDYESIKRQIHKAAEEMADNF